MKRIDLFNPQHVDGLSVVFKNDDGTCDERVILCVIRQHTELVFKLTGVGDELIISGLQENQEHLYLDDLLGFEIRSRGIKHAFRDKVYSLDYVAPYCRLHLSNSDIKIQISYES